MKRRGDHTSLPRPTRVPPRYPQTEWAGFCVDSTSGRTVVAWDQAIAYTMSARVPWCILPSSVVIHFGDNLATSKGIMLIRLAFLGQGWIVLDCHVDAADVPLLLGLDVLRTIGLT